MYALFLRNYICVKAMKNQPYLTPAEIEFLAEQECVTIVPNFKEKKLFFLTVSIYRQLFENLLVLLLFAKILFLARN